MVIKNNNRNPTEKQCQTNCTTTQTLLPPSLPIHNHHKSSSTTTTTISESFLEQIFHVFPNNVSYALAYGSAVFPQNKTISSNMIDLIFVVSDPIEWHGENLKRNPEHYSGLRYLGANAIGFLQENLGCGIYYNSYAIICNHVIKYGVISISAFIDDLTNWTFLYVAGRIHKPIRSLKDPSINHPEIIKHICQNRSSALAVSLLMLPQKFTKVDLYYKVTEISYIGDSRMIIGENPNKVQNIVLSNMIEFDEIYLPFLVHEYSTIVQRSNKKNDQFYQDLNEESRLCLLKKLPYNLKINVVKKFCKESIFPYLFQSSGVHWIGPSHMDETRLDSILDQVSRESGLSDLVREALAHLVWLSSLRQTCLGFLSTGLIGSLKYAWEKVKKKFV